MHRDGFTKHPRIAKSAFTPKPCFSGEHPERFLSSLFLYIYIHLAYTKAKNELGRCHSVPCRKIHKRYSIVTQGDGFDKRNFTDATGSTQPSIDLNTKSRNFTHKLLAKCGVFLSISHPRLGFPDAVCYSHVIQLIYVSCYVLNPPKHPLCCIITSFRSRYRSANVTCHL